MKPRIVVSGVNLTEMGPLSVFKDALTALERGYAKDYELIALVHKRALFDLPNVTLMEYPEIKASWLKRIQFEYVDCRAISRTLKPLLWFSMHDITPNVWAERQAVYCHNPSPFYRLRLSDALLDWKFALFALFYRFLYAINIRKNRFVVVQQDWIRGEFRRRYQIDNVIVAHPTIHETMPGPGVSGADAARKARFFYPAYPRIFKNIEQVLDAARLLQEQGVDSFEIWLTVDGTETAYSRQLKKRFADVRAVRWLGLQARDEVLRIYGDVDFLVFPSRLETWGMPITEFKSTTKPILAIDLPYAHETVGDYDRVAFFPDGDALALAGMMKQAAEGHGPFSEHRSPAIAGPFAQTWDDLWRLLLVAE